MGTLQCILPRLVAGNLLFGSKSAIKCSARLVSTSPGVSLRASKDIGLWKKLYEKDYIRRKKLSQFLDGLAQIIADREKHMIKPKEYGRSSDKPKGFTIQSSDSDTVKLNSELSQDWIMEMMKRADSNDTLLDASAFRKIIELARPILHDSPNITLVPKVAQERPSPTISR